MARKNAELKFLPVHKELTSFYWQYLLSIAKHTSKLMCLDVGRSKKVTSTFNCSRLCPACHKVVDELNVGGFA
jgi:hypothetical protein